MSKEVPGNSEQRDRGPGAGALGPTSDFWEEGEDVTSVRCAGAQGGLLPELSDESRDLAVAFIHFHPQSVTVMRAKNSSAQEGSQKKTAWWAGSGPAASLEQVFVPVGGSGNVYSAE